MRVIGKYYKNIQVLNLMIVAQKLQQEQSTRIFSILKGPVAIFVWETRKKQPRETLCLQRLPGYLKGG